MGQGEFCFKVCCTIGFLGKLLIGYLERTHKDVL